MTMYHMINGVSPFCFFVMPMLGEKHPDDYPRFRDCFLDTAENEPKYDQDIIVVHTRVGGNNREEGYGEEELYQHPNFLDTFDDYSDNTYGNYIFSVPNEFKDDYLKIKQGKYSDISINLKEKIIKMFPKIQDKLKNHLDYSI